MPKGRRTSGRRSVPPASTRITLAPAPASWAATIEPAEPAPTTTKSASRGAFLFIRISNLRLKVQLPVDRATVPGRWRN
jgi:hypothetical protein